MNRFLTLLQREWLQHRTGWLVLALAPTTFVLLGLLWATVSPTAEVQASVGEDEVGAFVLPMIVMGLTTAIAVLTLAFQAPGLARRDVQDRSIEFWLAQPVGHSASIGATLLAHLLLWPMAAAVIGFAGGLVVLPLVMLEEGADFMWGGLPAAVPLFAAVAVLCRALLGIALAMLWLSPLILLVMAASAWLKRWGLPLLMGSALLIALAEKRLAGTRHFVDMLAALFQRVGEAFVTRDTGLGIEAANVAGKGFPRLLADMPMLLLQDAGSALANLAAPALLPTLLIAGLCFHALVLKRQRGG
jgi:hypothetical protein